MNIEGGDYYKEQKDYDNIKKYYLMAIKKGNEFKSKYFNFIYNL